MAVAYLNREPVSRGSGQSIIAASAYIACANLTAPDGEKDFSKKSGLKYAEIMTHDGKPQDRQTLWAGVEAREKRKDSQLGYSYKVALPNELTEDQNRALAQEFAKSIIERYGFGAVDLCIHYPVKRKTHADKTKENPHFHLLTPTRDKNGQKLRLFRNASQDIGEVRQIWQDTCNRHLKEAGHPEAQIDLRNAETQLEECQNEIKRLEAQRDNIEKELEAIQNERATHTGTTGKAAFWRYRQLEDASPQPMGSGDKAQEQPATIAHDTKSDIPAGTANNDPANNRGADGTLGCPGLDECAELRRQFWSSPGLDLESRGTGGESLLPPGATAEIVGKIRQIGSRLRGLKWERGAEAYRIRKAKELTAPITTLAARLASRIRGLKYDLAAEQYYRKKAKNEHYIKSAGSPRARLEREIDGHPDRLEREAAERSPTFEGQREKRQDARPYSFGPTL